MKTSKNRAVLILGLVLILSLMLVGVAEAAPAQQLGAVDEALGEFVALLGLGAAVSTFVQVLKTFGVIPDGMGGQVVTLLNLLIYISAVVAGFFGLDVGSEPVRQALMYIGEAVTTILMAILFFAGMRKAEIPGFRSSG